MTLIRRIIISGFRGIVSPLTLDFMKGSSARSMVIYGRNGTGKSSITDAWEWLHTEKIGHLAREGAGPSSYPNISAKDGEVFVEIEFVDQKLGTARLQFDQSRITRPRSVGNVAAIRNLAPHPCHIRFDDLTRFVYLTKAERYDVLAQLMGFTPQVETQMALRRVLRLMKEELENTERDVRQRGSELARLLELDSADEPSILNKLNTITAIYDLPVSVSIEELKIASDKLTDLVEQDPRSQELANLGRLGKAVEVVHLPDETLEKLKAYFQQARLFKKEEKSVLDLLLVSLYEQGQQVLTQQHKLGLDIKTCPLCGSRYEGDLYQHISSELTRLQKLKDKRDNLDRNRVQIRTPLNSMNELATAFKKDAQDLDPLVAQYPVSSLLKQASIVDKLLANLKKQLSIRPENLDITAIKSAEQETDNLLIEVEQLQTVRTDLLDKIGDRFKALNAETQRAKLVEDHKTLILALDQWEKLKNNRRKLVGLQQGYAKFEAVVEDFVCSSTYNVQKRFDVISSDVQTYFSILEEHTPGIGRPALKLHLDQDRAVSLEVEFHGQSIFPAYRYLSESQLNSFGLAVFLASAKHFNKDFKFLILDDVINSFDGYKRPQVIKLLQQEFSDHQVLLFTHDSVWRDRLFEACPQWVKRQFPRHEPGIGPISYEGACPLETIEKLIDDDQPVQAGRNMGPFLERKFQELCEAFEALVKYNQRNEYTLDPLLDRFRVRIKEKLGQEHPLYKAIEALQQESGFRNLSAHWKNPDIQITPEEMKMVVERWKAIEQLVRCQEPTCYRILRYDGKKFFVCACGATRLEKVKPQ